MTAPSDAELKAAVSVYSDLFGYIIGRGIAMFGVESVRTLFETQVATIERVMSGADGEAH